MHRLDQINAKKPANPLDCKSLTLEFRSKRIGRFFWVIRPGDSKVRCPPSHLKANSVMNAITRDPDTFEEFLEGFPTVPRDLPGVIRK